MNGISRREFLRVSALIGAGTLAAACAAPGAPAAPSGVVGQPTAEPAAPAAPAGPIEKYTEAPSLAALVAEGKLPPVEERLPEDPFVVGPGVLVVPEHLDWEVGEYSREGEVLRSVGNDPVWSYPCQHSQEHILACPPHHTGPITGNLVSSWSVNEDCTVYEFTLRKGLKWSDGVPVTTEDIRFTYEDVLMNTELTPVLASDLKAGAAPDGEPMGLEVLDDFTWRYTFAEPNGSRFLARLGMGNLWAAYSTFIRPKHYLQQFHIKYAKKEELEAKAVAAGLGAGEWVRLFQDEGGNWGGMDCWHMVEEGRLPVLRAWIVKESPPELIVMERNPYYFKVDTEGKQLPYVERVEGVVVSDLESIPMTIVAGEVNFVRERLRHTDVALYKEHEAENDYKVVLDMVYHNAPVALYFNMNTMDENWRQVVWQKEFRQAINAAIDYKEIIDSLYLGLGTTCPWLPDVNDKDQANALLDSIGLDKRDADGWRLYPDGTRLEFRMDVRLDPLYVKPAEVIKAHLEEVGINTPLKMMEAALWNQIRDANELYASIDWCDDCNWPFLKDDFMPNQRILWAQLWQRWMEGNTQEGEEPPDWMKELYGLHKEIMASDPRTSVAEDALARFTEWYKEYVPILPLARDVVDPCLVPKNAGNIAHAGRSSAVWFSLEQVFFKHT
jgi:peptide/nickel transport system substrate-binding protein